MAWLGILWNLVIESAPWLLLGYLLAGVIKQVIPGRWVEKQLARPGFLSIIKGAFIGAPLPLCSCGVIPTALAIRKAGASKGATSSFLVATPETGIDSISFSYAVLGPVFAVMRPVGALISAVVAGTLVNGLDRMAAGHRPTASQTQGSCCASGHTAEAAVEAEVSSRWLQRLRNAIHYGYGRMISDTARWLVIGLISASIITVLVPQSFFLQWGDGLLAMLVMVVVGLPMYVCAAASTPVAASLLFAGISPGAALVFMLTGPATNIATMGVIREQLGTRSLLGYLIGVIGTAVVCGLSLNAMYASFGWPLQLTMAEHAATYPWWRHLAALLLLGLIARVWVQPLFGRFRSLRAVTRWAGLSSKTVSASAGRQARP